MLDLRVTTIRRILTIVSVQFPPNSLTTMLVLGEHLNHTNEVQVNDRRADFVVISPSKMLVTIPTALRADPVQKVLALTDTPRLDEASKLYFDVGPTLRSAKGSEATIQLFIKLAMTTPGTNKFRPSSGGGLLSLIGLNMEEGAVLGLQARAVEAVMRAQDEVTSLQNQNRRLSNDERLVSAGVQGIGVRPDEQTIPIVANLAFASGRRALAGVEI